MRIVCHLRAAREAKGLHLRQMEELTGVSRGTLSQIERGERLPKDKIVPALEDAYGLPCIEWYFAGCSFAIVSDDGQAGR